MNGKIYDAQSIEKNLIQGLSNKVKGQNMYFADRFEVGETIYDAGTVGDAGMFVEQQLRVIVPRVLEQKFPDLVGLNLVNDVDNTGKYMEALIQRAQSYQGDFQDVNVLSDNKGLITTGRDAKTIPIRTKRGYSVLDNITMKRAEVFGENIKTDLIKGHKVKYDQFIDKMIFLGMDDSDIQGLATYTSYVSGNRQDADETFATSANKDDGMKIYNQIAKVYRKHIGNAKGVSAFTPKYAVLPTEQYAILASTPIAIADTGKIGLETVLEYIERKWQIKVFASERMKGTGDGSTDRMMLLSNVSAPDPMFTLYIPMPLEFLPVDYKAGSYEIYSQFRVAGVSINYNNCISYLDGI
jgi:hypothetical protein